MTDRRSEGLTSPLWFSVQFGALVILGYLPATVVAGIGAATPRLKADGVRASVAPTVTAMAAMLVSGLLFNRLARTSNISLWIWQACVVAATVAAYCAVTQGLTIAWKSIASRSLDRAWRNVSIRDLRNCLIGASAAVLIVYALSHRQLESLPFIVLPLYLIFTSYRDTTERQQIAGQRQAVIESLDEGVCVVGFDGRISMWNSALERMLSCPRDQAIGRSVTEAVPILAGTAVADALSAAIAHGADPGVLRLMLPAAAGGAVLQVKMTTQQSGVMLLWHDVTLGSRADSALKRSEERFALMESSISDGLWEWDLRAQVVRFSGQWRNIVGLAPVSSTGSPDEWFDRVHAQDLDSLKQAINAYLADSSEELIHQHRLRHEDGTYRHVVCRGIVVRGPRRRAVRLGGSLTDVTDRNGTAQSLQDSGTRDPLTGLSNRAVFGQLLGQRLTALKKRQGGHFAVLFLDLDRFKVINDSLGHLVGDELLVAVSRRLESCLREGDLLARLGGDEFAIFLNELHDEAQANAIAFRIQDVLSATFSIGGREVFTSTSIGIAFSAFRYNSADEIMRDADTAMYHAKSRGKARHEVFDAEMHAEALDRLGLENDLRRALMCNELEVHYQPIVQLNSGACVGFEALVRWTVDGKPVPPARFIPVAEELGLVESLGSWVLREACRTFAEWQLRFPNSGFDCITVNVSTRQLVQQGFYKTVEDAVRAANLVPSHLRLEITETALLASPQTTAVLLQKLRDLGVKIYLDDFGTGQSSLSHLHQLPVDALKIDRSFVNSLLLPERPAIIESILALAYTLETGVVAEGVEDEVQALQLERLGCRYAQGFLFSPPVPASKVEELLTTGQPLVGSRRLLVDSSPNAQLPWITRPEVAVAGVAHRLQ
jgi:diguanylate cyclase (GGDEF)-like protein/PAS domain S-box-containing protein